MKDKSKNYKLKPTSLYPLKPEEALKRFMQVDPEKIKKAERKEKKGRSEK